MKKVNSVLIFKLALAVLLVLGISMFTYYGSTQNEFVWDTLRYLNKHPVYLSSLSVDHIVWMFLSMDEVNWHPLTWLSWAIDYQIYGGLDPAGYHLSNIVLHAINSALLFVVILVVFGLNKPSAGNYPLRTDNSALIAACGAAILFAIHPQHVESVVWVAERKDLLCQLFMLLSMLTYVKFVCCQEVNKKRWFLTSLGLYFLAVLSKPMAVTFPVVLLLIDVYPLRRSALIKQLNYSITQQTYYTLLREKLPFFLLSFFLILITLKAQQGALVEVPLNLRLLNAFNSIILYLSKLFVPLHFSPHYPYFINVGETITWESLMPLLAVLGVSVASLWAWTRGQYAWLISWLFYLVTLSPVLGLIQVGEQGAADRYTYFPTLPVYVLAGVAMLTLFEQISAAKKWLVVLLFIPLVLLLANQTVKQIRVWKDPYSLWQHAVKYSPRDRLAQLNLGITNVNKKNFEDAAVNFEMLGQLEPDPVNSLAWRGLVYLHLKRYQEALDMHTELRRASGSLPESKVDRNCIQYNIGWVSTQLGMLENAVRNFNGVDLKAKLRPSANIWLESLANKTEIAGVPKNREGLPGYCEALIPAMAVQGRLLKRK